MRGPTTAAKASPELKPKTAAETAMASSKLLPVAVKATEAFLAYSMPRLWPTRKLAKNMGKIRKEKRYHYDDVGVSIVAALLPLLFGGCVGPEAGLTGSIAGLCTWAGDRMEAVLASAVTEMFPAPGHLSAMFSP